MAEGARNGVNIPFKGHFLSYHPIQLTSHWREFSLAASLSSQGDWEHWSHQNFLDIKWKLVFLRKLNVFYEKFFKRIKGKKKKKYVTSRIHRLWSIMRLNHRRKSDNIKKSIKDKSWKMCYFHKKTKLPFSGSLHNWGWVYSHKTKMVTLI